MIQQEPQSLLESHLHRGVEICVKTWPTLKLAIKDSWLHENKNFHQDPRIASFKKKDSLELMEAIVDQLYDYILKHDVEVIHLEDYFEELMDSVFCADCEDLWIKMMATQLVELIQELEKGKLDKMEEFEKAYDKMKGEKVTLKCQNDDSEDEEDGDEEGEYSDEEEEGEKMEIEEPRLTEQQKALEDDGWTVVTKKKR